MKAKEEESLVNGDSKKEDELKKVVTSRRKLSGTAYYIFSIMAVLIGLFAVKTTFLNVWDAYIQRSLLLMLASAMVFPLYRASNKVQGDNVPWYDWLLFLVPIISIGYIFVNATNVSLRYAYVTPLSTFQLIVGILGLLIFVEIARRVMGMGLVTVMAIGFIYVGIGPYLPGMLQHNGFTLMHTIDHLFFTNHGVFGVPVGVIASFVMVFVLFGIFLDVAGGGRFFIDLSMSIMGSIRGGPAKTAVIASGLMGMLTGSVTAIIVTIGAFCVPLMMGNKVDKDFAAAALASGATGGQIMPPIMGATAFLVAEYSGNPYAKVALGAFLPAVLFYLSLLLMVDIEALKHGLKGIPSNLLPKLGKVLLKGFYYILPLLLIVYALAAGYSAMRAGLYGVVAIFIVSFFNKDTMFTPKKLLVAIRRTGEAMLIPAISVGVAGIVVGIMSLTGLGLKLTAGIVHLSGGSLLVAMVLTGGVCLILGMGLPAVAAYLIQVAFTIPALIELGANPLAAHLFVLYFVSFSFVTPPVAIGAYTAAGLTDSSPTKAGFVAWKICIAGFIIPFIFVSWPSLVFQGPISLTVVAFFFSLVGIVALTFFVMGWFLTKTTVMERILLFIGAFGCVTPGWIGSAIGACLVLAVYLLQKKRIGEVTAKIEEPSSL